jgi:hypothetical protein
VPGPQKYGVLLDLLAGSECTVAPGEEQRLEAVVRNAGSVVESLAVWVEAPVSWIAAEPATLSLFPGGRR